MKNNKIYAAPSLCFDSIVVEQGIAASFQTATLDIDTIEEDDWGTL